MYERSNVYIEVKTISGNCKVTLFIYTRLTFMWAIFYLKEKSKKVSISEVKKKILQFTENCDSLVTDNKISVKIAEILIFERRNW